MSVDDVNRLNLNRASGPCALPLARVAFDERGQIPSALRQPRPDDDRARETDAPDHRSPIDELADAVAERDFVDVDEGLPAARHADVAELKAAQQRPLEPADAERGCEVVVRLVDQQIANAVLRPAGL